MGSVGVMREGLKREEDRSGGCGEEGCGCDEGVGVISDGVMWEGVGNGCRLWRVENIRCGKGAVRKRVGSGCEQFISTPPHFKSRHTNTDLYVCKSAVTKASCVWS